LTYCTAAEVRLVVNTELSDEEIATLIETSDAYIDKALGAQSPLDKLIKKLSMLLTARTIKTRHPQSYAVGEYSESAGNVLEIWDREIEAITASYRRSFRVA